MYLVEKIIEKCENSKSDWREGARGGRSMKIEQKEYDACGKTELIRQALCLESEGLIQIKWLIRGSDVEKVCYQLEDLGKFYGFMEKETGLDCPSKQEKLAGIEAVLEAELEELKTPWIRKYYKDLLQLARDGRLEKGELPRMMGKVDIYLSCFRGIDKLESPVYKRIFSRNHLSNSKVFEKEAQKHIISKAKEYWEEIDPDMSDTEVLSQLLIEEYSQELALKGPLNIQVEKDGKQVKLALADYLYGTVLNSETLKHAKVQVSQPDIHRVMTIENKANFVSAQYEEHTLYIFTHGYLSPREREFLRGLGIILEGHDVEFYHSGDLDYGGVKIYEYMKRKVFPEIKPWRMDVETYEAYLEYGELISESTLKKLEAVRIPEVQPLVDRMREVKLGIEQESFLL